MPVSKMPVVTKARFIQFFREADTKKDGVLSFNELSKALRANGFSHLTTKELKRLFQETDLDNDDKISLREFLIAMGQKPDEPKPINAKSLSILRRIFKLYDHDNSGEIDKSEMKLVFKELGTQMSEEDATRVMELADKDNSGSLNYEEFLKVLLKENEGWNKYDN